MTIVGKLNDANIGDIVQLFGDCSEIVGYITKLTAWKIKLSQENPFNTTYHLFFRNKRYDLNNFTNYTILKKYTNIRAEEGKIK